MAIYDKKVSVNTCKTSFTRVNTGKSDLWHSCVLFLVGKLPQNLSPLKGGMKGLYGPGQHDWFLDEKGLMHSEKYNKSQPKEPTAGFQLFASRPQSEENTADTVKNFDLVCINIEKLID